MKTFRCDCGQLVFFENPRCLSCNRALGYVALPGILSTLEPAGEGLWHALTLPDAAARFRLCANYAQYNVCNWLVAEDDPDPYCLSCRLNDVIPDLSLPENRVYWARMETAKRRLIYSLLQLKLPVAGKTAQPEQGLSFRFLADPAPEFRENSLAITGHASGIITINLAEADDVVREARRVDLNEPYRTLLGHFRHESGHYYWERLIKGTRWLQEFRALFGEETQDYDELLRSYYEQGPRAGWQENFVTAYASAHPWEDWAESWAHYLHMVDTMETARDFGLTGKLQRFTRGTGGAGGALPARAPESFAELLDQWLGMTYALNSINRSMGLRDLYPFVLSAPAAAKLRFVHELIHQTER